MGYLDDEILHFSATLKIAQQVHDWLPPRILEKALLQSLTIGLQMPWLVVAKSKDGESVVSRQSDSLEARSQKRDCKASSPKVSDCT